MVSRRDVIFVAAVALAVGVLIGTLLESRDLPSVALNERGAVVIVGGLDSLPDIDRQPWCNESQRFCLIKTPGGELRALYTYDTNAVFRSQGCVAEWRPDFPYTNPATGEVSQGWFRDSCGGSTYDRQGKLVFGPAPRDLDRFPVTISSKDGVEQIEVDTRVLICASAEEECRPAPAPQ
jgi:hypothetical protein